eukprot:TRINITY_DN2966_c0_g1_i3.p1 TRINITY_DN2966_c0_g1~~TRINITY_DN2966_c0_g1_i3.p1  ORF type:complete len:246 (+),score=48.92 TRINITY_DN2966_c0_g1_i3:412-1149(+)
MEQQQRLRIDSLETALEESRQEVQKLKGSNWHEHYLKMQLENNKLKKVLEEKTQLIRQLKSPLHTLSKKPSTILVKSQSSKDNSKTQIMKTISIDVHEDPEENGSSNPAHSRSKIAKKSFKSIGQKKGMSSLSSSKALKSANTTLYHCSVKPLDKENEEQNSRKRIRKTENGIKKEGAKIDPLIIVKMINKCSYKVQTFILVIELVCEVQAERAYFSLRLVQSQIKAEREFDAERSAAQGSGRPR